jgi:5-methylcytosine-specific restriction endonuclease McrA
MEKPRFNPPKSGMKALIPAHASRLSRGANLGWAWQALRKAHLIQHPYCARCQLLGSEVHHIQPRSVAPERTMDPTNLMTLCRSCHHLEHHPHRIKNQ